MQNQKTLTATSVQPIVLPPFAPYYADEAVTIYNADCRQVLPFLPKFDLLLTDPPYGIDYDARHKTSDRQWSKNGNRVIGDDIEFDPSIFDLSSAIVWGGNNFASRLPDSGGWLIWDKKRGGTVSKGYRGADCELAWSSITKRPSIFVHLWNGYQRDSEIGQHWHPTQKPVALMRWCLSLVEDAVTVLDPFAGSGTTGVACKLEGRKAVLVEISEEYCEKAADRLRQGVLF